MEPPREAEGMDPELAAQLGIQISDERTQEANVLGARLATGVSAPPLALAFLGSGFFDSKDAFPEEALEKLIGLAGDGDRASVLRAALSAVGDDALAAAVPASHPDGSSDRPNAPQVQDMSATALCRTQHGAAPQAAGASAFCRVHPIEL